MKVCVIATKFFTMSFWPGTKAVDNGNYSMVVNVFHYENVLCIFVKNRLAEAILIYTHNMFYQEILKNISRLLLIRIVSNDINFFFLELILLYYYKDPVIIWQSSASAFSHNKGLHHLHAFTLPDHVQLNTCTVNGPWNSWYHHHLFVELDWQILKIKIKKNEQLVQVLIHILAVLWKSNPTLVP